MTTKQTATRVLQIVTENSGYRVQLRWLAGHLKVTAEELSAALDLLGRKIIRVRGAGAYIVAA